MKTTLFYTPFLIAIGLLVSCNQAPHIGTEGKIKRESISVTTKIPGRIEKLFVAEGDFAKQGDTLAILNSPEIGAKIAQAQGAVKAATAQYQMASNGATPNQLKQLQAKHDALKEQYDFAQKSFNRVAAMFTDSLIAPQAYDEAFAKYKGAQAQYNAAVAELAEAKGGVRNENKLMALGQKEQANGVLQEAQTAEREKYIIAPVDMSIETIALHEGELATPGYALFSGYLPGTTWFRFTLPEGKINTVKKGEIVNVYVPYLNQDIEGKIITIKQLAKYANISTAYPDYQMEEAVYEVKIIPTHTKETTTLLNNATALLK